MNDQDLQLRGDRNHGVGWYGGGKPFAGVSVDGPVLYGLSGGGLGTVQAGSATNLALYWNAAGNVGIGTNGPSLSAGNAQRRVLQPGRRVDKHLGSQCQGGAPRPPLRPARCWPKSPALPITQWKYKVEPDGVKHIGPMEKDSH